MFNVLYIIYYIYIHTGCNIKQASHTFPLGTLISMVTFSFIMLLLIVGATYGYFQVGKYIIIAKNGHNSVRFCKRSLHEKLIPKN